MAGCSRCLLRLSVCLSARQHGQCLLTVSGLGSGLVINTTLGQPHYRASAPSPYCLKLEGGGWGRGEGWE